MLVTNYDAMLPNDPTPAAMRKFYEDAVKPAMKDSAKKHVVFMVAALKLKAAFEATRKAGVPIEVPPSFADVQPEALALSARAYLRAGLIDLDDEALRGVDLG